MAEQPAQERTLPATPHRRRQARERGQTLRSRELAATAVLVGAAAVFLFTGTRMYQTISTMMIQGLSLNSAVLDSKSLMLRSGLQLVVNSTLVIGPLFAVVVLSGLLGGVAIGGWSFSSEALSPQWSRISITEGFRRMFSAQGLGELIKALLKLLIISGVSAAILWIDRKPILSLLDAPARDAILQAGVVFAHFFFYLSAATVAVLVFDIPFQIRQYAKQLRMSPQEVREELKETEGHPEVKRRIRRLQQEKARQRMMTEAARADVVVTNPTHYAVAIRYEPERRSAPVVVAKGANAVAERIREVASEHSVPVLEAPALARALYRNVPLGAEVPSALYQAVAQVLAYVYQLKVGRAQGPLGSIEVPESLREIDS